jgi:hypothetical protein
MDGIGGIGDYHFGDFPGQWADFMGWMELVELVIIISEISLGSGRISWDGCNWWNW